jgi:hypothetical protein
MQQAPPQPPHADQPRPESPRCPTCGVGSEPGQLVCLECGSRISLGYRKPPSWRVPVAIIAFLLLLVAGGLAVGLREVTSDADTEVAGDQKADKPTTPPASSGGGGGSGKPAKKKDGGEAVLGQSTAKPKPKAKPKKKAEAKPKKKKPAEPAAPAPRVGGVASWPKNRSAYAVVLVSTDSRDKARKVAQRAIKEGVDGAGVLRSDDFSSLGKGLWISFGGVYGDRNKAAKDAKRFDRGFPGAFVQFIDGAAPGSRG